MSVGPCFCKCSATVKMRDALNVLPDNLLGVSWVDSGWVPILNPGNVLDYFSERSNPFYDRTCNNEVVKMQRLTLDHLNQMVGVEYILLHAQEPILYIIRKQQRQSPTQVVPLADYYIIAGVVYQAPDLGSVISSRVLSAVHGIQSAFDEAMSFCRYHPSKGYWWHFKDQEEREKPVPGKYLFIMGLFLFFLSLFGLSFTVIVLFLLF
uniref:Mediator of RNA polymerase II transcription subunit 6 n=1 Tax=Pygocentrus nattereri TaxID=42514 RepID=A0AAR2JBZ1_PYGNA